MSDNFSAANGGTPITIATKEAGGVHTPRNLLVVDGQDVGPGNPLPVTTQFPSTQEVSSQQLLTALSALYTALTATLQVSGPLTNTELRAAPIDVALDFPAVQPVSGPLTNTELRAAAVPVHVDNQPTQPLTDTQLRAAAVTVHVDNQPTQPLTNAELRATAVPVSGPLTDTQLRAAAVPVSAAAMPLPTGSGETNRSGNVTTANQAQTIMAANAGRKYFELQNLSSTDFLWFRKDGQPAGVAATGSFALAPASSTSVGGFYSGQSTGAVSVVSVTAGHPFSAVEA